METEEKQYHAAIEDYKIVDDTICIPFAEVKRLHEFFVDVRLKQEGLTQFGEGLELGRCSVFRHMLDLFYKEKEKQETNKN